MWYMPYMRVRSAVLIYAYIVIGISFAGVALHFWPGAIHSNGHHLGFTIDLSMLVSASAALVGGLATVLGLNLAAENDGHLELAWTKPVSREGYALGVFAVDIVAMAACILLTLLFGVILVDLYSGTQAVALGSGQSLLNGLAFCGFPVCIYAWVAALSASLKRNRGTVAGLLWPLMGALALLQLIPVQAIHSVALALNLFNPIEIYTTNSKGPEPSLWTFAWGWGVAALLLAVSVLQWRRLQL